MNNPNKTSQEIIDTINNLSCKTDRLVMKKFSLADVDSNVDHEMNPEIMRYIRDPMPQTEVTAKTMQMVADWQGQEQEWVLIAVRLRDNNEYIGMVCMRYLSIENNTIELGWRLGTEHHGKGFATEAAKELLNFIIKQLKPHKAVAYCVAENIASSNIMSKLGMHKEAHFKQFSMLAGQWHDEVVYGIILD